jgi:hypothetical protein
VDARKNVEKKKKNRKHLASTYPTSEEIMDGIFNPSPQNMAKNNVEVII